MSARKPYRGYPMPEEALRQRRELARSGAAGVHADQNARKAGAAGRTNRVGSRSARKAAAIRDQYR